MEKITLIFCKVLRMISRNTVGKNGARDTCSVYLTHMQRHESKQFSALGSISFISILLHKTEFVLGQTCAGWMSLVQFRIILDSLHTSFGAIQMYLCLTLGQGNCLLT